MGSHGTKAIAAAVLGAEATCVDISPVNAAYGSKVAAAAGVQVDFVVADVLQLPADQLTGEVCKEFAEHSCTAAAMCMHPLLYAIATSLAMCSCSASHAASSMEQAQLVGLPVDTFPLVHADHRMHGCC